MSAVPILRVEGLCHTFTTRGRVRALDDVSFEIARGETLALVGASGSGKSTLARVLLGLLRPDAGRVLFASSSMVAGSDLCALRGRDLRVLRPKIQIVFQDPQSSLDPRARALEVVAEVLRLVRGLRGPAAERTARALLDRVGLGSELDLRRPHELSGGQRQRLCLARALATDPELLVLDEALASLDVSIQAQVLKLLVELRAERGLAYVFIAHDLALVRLLAQRTAVLAEGRLVEIGPTGSVLAAPMHAATRALVAASHLGERAG